MFLEMSSYYRETSKAKVFLEKNLLPMYYRGHSVYPYTVYFLYYIGDKQCTPTKGLLYYIGDKQCRGTPTGPYSIGGLTLIGSVLPYTVKNLVCMTHKFRCARANSIQTPILV